MMLSSAERSSCYFVVGYFVEISDSFPHQLHDLLAARFTRRFFDQACCVRDMSGLVGEQRIENTPHSSAPVRFAIRKQNRSLQQLKKSRTNLRDIHLNQLIHGGRMCVRRSLARRKRASLGVT